MTGGADSHWLGSSPRDPLCHCTGVRYFNLTKPKSQGQEGRVGSSILTRSCSVNCGRIMKMKCEREGKRKEERRGHLLGPSVPSFPKCPSAASFTPRLSFASSTHSSCSFHAVVGRESAHAVLVPLFWGWFADLGGAGKGAWWDRYERYGRAGKGKGTGIVGRLRSWVGEGEGRARAAVQSEERRGRRRRRYGGR